MTHFREQFRLLIRGGLSREILAQVATSVLWVVVSPLLVWVWTPVPTVRAQDEADAGAPVAR